MARETRGRLKVASDGWGNFPFSMVTGKIVGLTTRVVFGRSLDVDTTPEDIWAADGVMAYPSSATTLSVASSSANDDAIGTGARTVVVEYLDGNFETKEVEVELDGTNSVQVATDFRRMQDAFIRTAGTGQKAAGDITLSYTGGNTVGVIKTGRTDIENTHFTIPAGYTAYLTGGLISAGKSSDATIDFQVRDATNGAVFKVGQEVIVNETAVFLHLPVYVEVPEKYDIRIQGKSTQGNSAISVNYYLILKRNDWYSNE